MTTLAEAFRWYVAAAVETVRAPRDAMVRIQALTLDRGSRWLLLVLVAVVSAILGYVSVQQALAGMPAAMRDALGLGPFSMALMQLFVLWLMVVAISGLGRAMGGTGTLDDAIVAVTWIQAVLSGLQVVQIVVSLLLPAVSGLIGLAGLVIFFRLLTLFVAQMHGFRSVGGVFVTILLVLLMMATVLHVLLGAFGTAGTVFLGAV